jgi:hypothetical protein
LACELKGAKSDGLARLRAESIQFALRPPIGEHFRSLTIASGGKSKLNRRKALMLARPRESARLCFDALRPLSDFPVYRRHLILRHDRLMPGFSAKSLPSKLIHFETCGTGLHGILHGMAFVPVGNSRLDLGDRGRQSESKRGNRPARAAPAALNRASPAPAR